MKQQLSLARAQREPRKKLPRRTNCRQCGSKELLTVGPDQFCCDCSWDTCKEYVDLGLMNNLEVSCKEHLFKRENKSSPEIKKITTNIEPLRLKEIA